MKKRQPDWVFRIFLFLVAALLFSSAAFLVFNLSKTNHSSAATSSPPATPSICVPPSSGEIFRTTFVCADFTVPIGALGPGYYYVKLKDHISQKEVLSFFIHGKNTVNFEIDAGIYDLYFAHGDTWYGSELLFGDDTEYMMAESPIIIDSNNESIQIWTPSIICGENLALGTISISSSEFRQ